MSMIYDEIHKFIESNSMMIEEVKNVNCSKLRKTIDELYVDKGKKGTWLWEKLKCFDSLYDNNGWVYVKEYVSDNKCIMFFNEFDEKKMFKIKNGNDLFYLLSETSGFEFYITDTNCSYLLCFNHHDILYGCGNAKKWIHDLKILLAKTEGITNTHRADY